MSGDMPSQQPAPEAVEALLEFAAEVDVMEARTRYARLEFLTSENKDAWLALIAAESSYRLVASRARAKAGKA